MSFGNGWISHFLACLSPTPCLTICSCSYGRVFAIRFLQADLAVSPLRFHYGCCYYFQLPLFRQQVLAHVGHTRWAIFSAHQMWAKTLLTLPDSCLAIIIFQRIDQHIGIVFSHMPHMGNTKYLCG